MHDPVEVRSLAVGEPTVGEAIVALQRRSYQVEADLMGLPDLPPMRETAADLAAFPETFLGAFAGDDLLGVVSFEDVRAGVEICRLVVEPSAFRRGVASGLLAAVLARHGDGRAYLVRTGAANAPARRLYAKFGFEETGLWEVAPGVRVVSLVRPAR